MSNNIDFNQRIPGESEVEWKARIGNAAKREFEMKKKMMENDKTTNLKYETNTLQNQIIEMSNDVMDKYCDEQDIPVPKEAREIYECRFSYLFEKSPTIFKNIIEKIFPSPEEIKTILMFHKMLTDGKLTRHEMSQAYAEYKIKLIMKKQNNVEKIRKDDVWDIMRSKNSFADKTIYCSSSDSE
jgi:hypothetical protein